MTRTVVHYVDSAEFGGTEQCLLNLLSGFDRKFWRVVLMYHPHPALQLLLEKASKLAVALHPVPIRAGSWEVAKIRPLFKALRADRPTVFHAHLNWQGGCTGGLIAASLSGTPAVVATTHLFDESVLSRAGLAKAWFVDKCIDRYIAVSHSVAAKLGTALRMRDRKVSVVRNGIPAADYRCPPDPLLRSQLVGASGRPIVLTSARLAKQKGHRYLLGAAAMVPEALFVLAGEGPERPLLEAQAKSLGLNDRVRFLGHREDIPSLLSVCDLFVLPSLFEGLPLTILEAMAARRPVIASAVGGTEEVIVEGECGLLVPARNASALAAAVRRVLSDPILAGRLATAGQERVRREFSVQNMVDGVVQVYEELLELGGHHCVAQ